MNYKSTSFILQPLQIQHFSSERNAIRSKVHENIENVIQAHNQQIQFPHPYKENKLTEVKKLG